MNQLPRGLALPGSLERSSESTADRGPPIIQRQRPRRDDGPRGDPTDLEIQSDEGRRAEDCARRTTSCKLLRLSPVDPSSVVYSFDKDDLLDRGERHDNPVITDSKLPLLRTSESFKIVIWIEGSALQTPHYLTSHGPIQRSKVTKARVRPEDLPVRQRPNRFLTISWSVSRPSRMSSRALSRPIRKLSV
jgi:hypothetical protein